LLSDVLIKLPRSYPALKSLHAAKSPLAGVET
jgi:hypothetical protein